MDESRCSRPIVSMAPTGLGCHGNRDRAKGLNVHPKPGQSKVVSEASAGAKGCAGGTGFPLNVWLLLQLLCSCSLHTRALALRCPECTLILLTSTKPFHNPSLTSLPASAQTRSVTGSQGRGSILKRCNCGIAFAYVVLNPGPESTQHFLFLGDVSPETCSHRPWLEESATS